MVYTSAQSHRLRVSVFLKGYTLGKKGVCQGPRIAGDQIARNCLSCDAAFKAQGKFNRICDKCKNSDLFRFDTPSSTIKKLRFYKGDK